MIERVELRVGEKLYLPDDVLAEAEVIRPFDIDPNPSIAALAEASHVILKPDNVKKVSIDNSGGGITEIISFDGVQAAAHRKEGGDSHDRLISEMQGFNYDANAAIAEKVLKGKHEEIVFLAGYIESRRSISGGEAKDVIKRSGKRDSLLVRFKKRGGKTDERIFENVKDKTIYIEIDRLGEKSIA
jgi:hypothetical protein